MPFSPGAILPRDMNQRQWAEFAKTSGILADRNAKTFTPEWFVSDFSSVPTDELTYLDLGHYVVLWNANANGIGDTSLTTEMSFDGLPEEIRPRSIRTVASPIIDNNIETFGQAAVFPAESGTGTVVFNVYRVSGATITVGAFTAANEKGLPEGWMIQYPK